MTDLLMTVVIALACPICIPVIKEREENGEQRLGHGGKRWMN